MKIFLNVDVPQFYIWYKQGVKSDAFKSRQNENGTVGISGLCYRILKQLNDCLSNLVQSSSGGGPQFFLRSHGNCFHISLSLGVFQ